MTAPTWYAEDNRMLVAIRESAQRAADNTGQAQQIMLLNKDKDPAPYELHETVEPNATRQAAFKQGGKP